MKIQKLLVAVSLTLMGFGATADSVVLGGHTAIPMGLPIATEGTGCPGNSATAFTSAGLLLSCQSGVWAQVGNAQLITKRLGLTGWPEFIYCVPNPNFPGLGSAVAHPVTLAYRISFVNEDAVYYFGLGNNGGARIDFNLDGSFRSRPVSATLDYSTSCDGKSVFAQVNSKT